MGAHKGHKKAGGRQKGTQNKLTTTFKDLVSQTVQQLNANPKTSLISFAEKNPKEFWQIAAKLIPTELQGALEIRDITRVILPGGIEVEY